MSKLDFQIRILDYAFGPLVNAVLSVVVLLLLGNTFAPAQFGVYSLYFSYISMFSLIIHVGTEYFFVREFFITKNKKRLFVSCYAPGLLATLALTGLLLLVPANIKMLLFPGDNNGIVNLLAMSVILLNVVQSFSQFSRMSGNGFVFSVIQTIPKLSLTIGVLLVVVFKTENGVEFVLFFYVVGLMLSALVSAIGGGVLVSFSSLSQFRLGIFTEALRYSLPLWLSGVLYMLFSISDRLLLSWLSIPVELGRYGMAVSWAGLALILQAILTTVWAPILYKMEHDGYKKELHERYARAVLAIVTLLWCSAGVFAWVLELSISAEYTNLGALVLCSLAPAFMYTLSEVTSAGLTLTRKTNLVLLATLAAFTLNLLLNFLLIPIYGAEGAAIATTVSFMLFLIIKNWLAHRNHVKLNVQHLTMRLAVLALCAIGVNLVHIDAHQSALIFGTLLIWNLWFSRNELRLLFDKLVNKHE